MPLSFHDFFPSARQRAYTQKGAFSKRSCRMFEKPMEKNVPASIVALLFLTLSGTTLFANLNAAHAATAFCGQAAPSRNMRKEVLFAVETKNVFYGLAQTCGHVQPCASAEGANREKWKRFPLLRHPASWATPADVLTHSANIRIYSLPVFHDRQTIPGVLPVSPRADPAHGQWPPGVRNTSLCISTIRLPARILIVTGAI